MDSRLRSAIAGAALCFFFGAAPLRASAEPQFQLHDTGLSSGRLLFTLLSGNESDIYAIDFAKKKVIPVVVSPGVDEFPRCSPDGKQFAFYSDRSHDREIYIAKSDGSNVQQVTHAAGEDEDAAWSPDGTQLIFASQRLGSGRNLFISDLQGNVRKQLTLGGQSNTTPAWNPKKPLIAYSTSAHWPGWDIELQDLDSGKHWALTSGIASSCRPAWSPDGESLVYSSGLGKSTQLVLQKIGDTASKQLTAGAGRKYDAVWASDNILFFVAEKNPGAEDYRLFLLDLTTRRSRLALESHGAIRYLSFCPAE